MALPFVRDSLDGLPDAIKEQYAKQEDGTFQLDIDSDERLVPESEIRNLKVTLDKERTDRKKFEKAAKHALSDEERERYEEMVRESEKREADNLAKQGEWDKLKERLAATHKKELETTKKDLGGKLGEANSKLHRLVVRDRARSAALNAGVRQDVIDDVLSLTSASLDLREDEVVILDSSGEISTETLEDFYGKSFKEKRPIYYEPQDKRSGSGGSQKDHTRRDAAGSVVISREVARDVHAYRKAKAEADKQGVELQVTD